MSNGYSSGRVCDLFREHYTDNSTSYAGSDSDDLRMNANIEGMPSRTGHTHDGTAYSSNNVVSDSWVVHLRQRNLQT
jgi:hypothetical protein